MSVGTKVRIVKSTGEAICSTCHRAIPRHQDAILLVVYWLTYRGEGAKARRLMEKSMDQKIGKHLFPTLYCKGSPSRIAKIMSNSAYRSVYRKMLIDIGEKHIEE